MNPTKFRTKARAIELLGRNNVRDDITALIELIKNAYDADAENVGVSFRLNVPNPYLLIYEDGSGMTVHDILDKWLVLGTNSKKRARNQRVSEHKGRPLMGEKGIGRLASAALGQQIWVFTKHNDENWNTLYLNWTIFENPNVFIDDINIPFLTGQSLDEVGSTQSITMLRHMQYENLMNSGWLSNIEAREPHTALLEQYKDIELQIRRNQFPSSTIHRAARWIASRKNHGTIMLIEDLRHPWEKIFDPSTAGERKHTTSTHRLNRLGNFIDSFNHFRSDFYIELLVNDEKQELSYHIEPEMYDIFDVKVSGRIESGMFTGKIEARNADEEILLECNREFERGIDVTAGIEDPKSKDCGPVEIVLCHFEGEPKKTGLTIEERRRVEEVLDKVGGIQVLRDGMRILPYGEPQNDFLELEQNRSKNAGRYLFSHRNMFGEIRITSVGNPYLEDKASREGLIENEQYHYFIDTLQNLLVTIAVDYVTASRKSSKGLRQSYLNANERNFKRREREQRIKEEEERQAERVCDETKLKLLQGREALKTLQNGIPMLEVNLPTDESYETIMHHIQEFSVRVNAWIHRLEEQRQNLLITLDARYISHFPDDLIEEVNEYNESIRIFFESEIPRHVAHIDELSTLYNELLVKWRKGAQESNSHGTSRHQEINDQRLRFVKEQLEKQKSQALRQISAQVDAVKHQLESATSLDEFVEMSRQMTEGEIRDTYSKLNEQIQSLQTKVKTQRNECDSDEIFFVEESIVSLETQIPSAFLIVQERFHSELMKNAPKFLDKVFVNLSSLFHYTSKDDLLIGILKAENQQLSVKVEQYSDLANLGMASEIVNHEFNQLFTNVSDGLNNLKKGSLSPSQKYWVSQIESGFKAISVRHSQMSPMYRSANLRKRELAIRDVINDMIEFFSNRFRSNKIEVLNEIPADYRLLLSTSTIYPVLSNLIDNAIYWSINSDIRQILFWADISESAIYIEDSGPGIPLRYVHKIFEPFFTMRRNGRGLGLSIVQQVLRTQGYSIEAITDENIKKLDGACFKITLNRDKEV